MTRKFANNGQSTLSAAITSGATSLSLASVASFKDETGVALATPWALWIDSEILSVTDVVGTTLTVQRGQEGTTAAAHSLGAIARAVVTAGGLQALVRARHTAAAVPSGGVSGDRALGNGKIWINDGGAWKSVTIS